MKKISLHSLAVAVVLVIAGFVAGSPVALAFTLDKPIYVTNLANGLVGWWPFDGNTMTSNVADLSGQGNNGNLVNMTATTTSPGMTGQAIKFVGASSQYVNIGQPSSLNLTSAYTISLWLKPASFSNYQNAIGKCLTVCQMGIIIDSTGNWHAENSTADVLSNYTLSLNKWQMVTVVWTGSVMSTYTNGSLNTSSSTVTVASQVTNLTIGADTNNSHYFDGSIDDVRIFSRALSASEISQLYYLAGGRTRDYSFNGPDSLQPNLVGWWTFDGSATSGTSTAKDLSGQNHPATTVSFGTTMATTSVWQTAGTGSWTAPSGVTSVIAEVWGAGGGGGGGASSRGAGGGGGAGGYAKSNSIAVTGGSSYSYYVGAAGSGGSTSGTGGANGDNSMFLSSTTVLAVGGNGGGGGGSGAGGTAGSTNTGSIGATTFSGGTGAAGTGGAGGSGGGGGGSAGSAGNGGNATGSTAGSAGTPDGAAGGGGSITAGSAGSSPSTCCGAGGGGGWASNSTGAGGGNGSTGQLRITGYYGTNGYWSQGIMGQAAYLDGTRSYLNIGTGPSSVSTVSLWFRASTSTAQKIIDLDGGTHTISISSNTVSAGGFVSPTIYVDGAVSSTIADTQWHHIVVTTGTAINATALKFGQVGGTYCGCSLDDIRLYSRVATAAEITFLYKLGVGTRVAVSRIGQDRFSTGLLAWYTFDGSYMLTNVADAAGTYNGSLLFGTLGQTATTTVPGKMGQAIKLDGVDDYINVGTGPSSVSTVSLWFRASTSTAQKIIDLDGGTHTISISSNTVSAGGFVSPTIYVDGAVSSTIADTQWHLITVTTGTPINATALTLGKASGGVCGCSLDDVRLYSTVLAAQDIGKLYNLAK